MRPSGDLRSRAKAMLDTNSCVVVIDDDQEFRESLDACCGPWVWIRGCLRRFPTLWSPTRPIALPVWSSM